MGITNKLVQGMLLRGSWSLEDTQERVDLVQRRVHSTAVVLTDTDG